MMKKRDFKKCPRPGRKISAFVKIRLIEKSKKRTIAKTSYFKLFFLSNDFIFAKIQSGLLNGSA